MAKGKLAVFGRRVREALDSYERDVATLKQERRPKRVLDARYEEYAKQVRQIDAEVYPR